MSQFNYLAANYIGKFSFQQHILQDNIVVMDRDKRPKQVMYYLSDPRKRFFRMDFISNNERFKKYAVFDWTKQRLLSVDKDNNPYINMFSNTNDSTEAWTYNIEESINIFSLHRYLNIEVDCLLNSYLKQILKWSL